MLNLGDEQSSGNKANGFIWLDGKCVPKQGSKDNAFILPWGSEPKNPPLFFPTVAVKGPEFEHWIERFIDNKFIGENGYLVIASRTEKYFIIIR